MARKRQTVLFSLSFLDVMSCGFGAVVLVFLIINHSAETFWQERQPVRLSESRLLEYEVQEGRLHLAQLKNSLALLNQRVEETQGKSAQVLEELRRTQLEVSDSNEETLSREEQLRLLKVELAKLEQDVNRLRASQTTLDDSGSAARRFMGDGNRQYLTGLKLGGNRIMVLLDVSGSMLDDTIVNVIRRRNMSEERQRQAPKWQRAVRTVEWLVSQLPLESQFQLLFFNTEAKSAIADANGRWLPVVGGVELEAAIDAVKQLVPSGGTSLENLFAAINAYPQGPDNIFLITDSLPTQGTKPPRRKLVSGRDRQRFFNDAVKRLPRDVPINVILFPMEGDPQAASAFWRLTQRTRGSFMSPSEDWP